MGKSLRDRVVYLLNRAKDARMLARSTRQAEMSNDLLALADDYDRQAEIARRQAEGHDSLPGA
ncbi:MAG: hypothetical protein JO128_13045 [Alphaproteobacteria bacterium]|nr:hypothetical protein [Alphaproteobacteria bacterium]